MHRKSYVRRAGRVVMWIVVLAAAVTIAAIVLDLLGKPRGLGYRPAADPLKLTFTTVASGFIAPVDVEFAPGTPAKVTVVERRGIIWQVTPGQETPQLLLDLSDDVAMDSTERGMFSIAFHPQFARNGRFFVCYTAVPDGRLVVAEFRIDVASGHVRPESKRIVLEVQKPSTPPGIPNDIHHGGELRFGPKDGYLYVSLGDGTDVDFDTLAPQELDSLWGKILRIDVDGDAPYEVPTDNPFVGRKGALGEIWAYGFRNPWRFSFDPDGHTIWASDVGGIMYEEIDRVTRGGNYGWPIWEARYAAIRSNLKFAGFSRSQWYRLDRVVRRAIPYLRALTSRNRPPVLWYGHLSIDPSGGQAVVGGFVYRGARIPQLYGQYLFGDFVSGALWTMTTTTTGAPLRTKVEHDPMTISAIEAGPDGEPYVVDYARGLVYRLEPLSSASNQNGPRSHASSAER